MKVLTANNLSTEPRIVSVRPRHDRAPSGAALWTGRVFSGILTAMLLMTAAMDISKPPMVLQGLAQYGYPASSASGIGVALLASTILYALRPTRVSGALLLTGYLGGATATHVRLGQGPGNFLIPIVFAALLWGALLIRDPQLRRAFRD